MHIHTFKYCMRKGWSQAFPKIESEQALILIFGAPEFAEQTEPFTELQKAYPQATLAGCSTSGEIHHDLVLDDTLTVAIICFDQARFKKVTATIDSPEHSHTIGQSLTKELMADDLKGVFVLSDGIGVNGTELVKGLSGELPQEVLVSGGLAGDKDAFEKTWVIRQGMPVYGCVAAIGFYGEKLEIGYGSEGGWDNFGPERKITKSSGNQLLEIDGLPALDLYKEYLGDRAQELPASALLFPLAIRPDMDSEMQVVRTILSIDEEQKTMTFAGDIPENWCAQFMRANFDRLIDGANSAGAMARIPDATDKPVLSLAVSCVGRRLVLGERADEEIESTLEGLPDKTSQIGFYSYGEISPKGFEACNLHNQTMTITTLFER